jgi:hypothetical protein
MNSQGLYIAAMAAIAVAAFGLVFGITGTTEGRRKAGLRILQFGMGIGGFTLIGGAILGGDGEDAVYGLLLLLFGTGVTAIGRAKAQRTE